MIEEIMLGAAQGIAEWLPISSEGLILFLKANIGGSFTIGETIRLALFLHLGTFLAALIYFRKEVFSLLRDLFRYKKADSVRKRILNFYIIATAISGLLGFIILHLIEGVEDQLIVAGRTAIIILGLLLLVTGFIQIARGRGGEKNYEDIKFTDGIIVGVSQGLAVFPGLSRSGLTVSALLMRKFQDTVSLRLSFILSLPIVLGGNILLNLDKFSFSSANLISLAASFVFGIATIHLFLRVAEKIQFGWFVLGFATLVFVSAFFVF